MNFSEALTDCGAVTGIKQVFEITLSYTKGASTITNFASGKLVVEVQ